MNKADQVLAQLRKYGQSQEDQLAALEAIETKRRREQFIRYWQPVGDEAKAIKQFTDKVKIFVILGGNRSGKTELGAFITTAFALGKDYFKGEPAWEWVKDLPIGDPPNNIWAIGLDYSVLKNVIWGEKFATGLEHPGFYPKGPEIAKDNASELRTIFNSGSIITGKSADAGREKFQSATIDLGWIDEECDAEIFDETYQRTLSSKGKLLVTATPLVDIASGAQSPWLYDLYERSKTREDIVFVHLSFLNNPYVPEEEKISAKEKWAGHFEEKARLYGEFIQRSGLVYNMWNRDVHTVAPFPIPGDWRRFVSIDPSGTGTTAAVWAAIDQSGNMWLYNEYYEAGRVVSEHAKAIRIRNHGDLVDTWLIDPKFGSQRNPETHKSNLQLYRDAGIPVRLAEVQQDFGLNASLEYMNASLDETSTHPKVYVFDDLKNFIQEVEHYSWAFYTRGEMKGLSKDKPAKKNDHLMNAFQYLCAMRPRYRMRHTMNEGDRKQFAQLNSYT